MKDVTSSIRNHVNGTGHSASFEDFYRLNNVSK